ncbi:MarR family transcriptional regulator [Streptomyces xanthochromogenes]|uniref:MarR family transcriptional regulator n=1 Tax=Streptomyces xanthochromogenes TaxID=67384 RepID=A0ABQ3AP84_9ACTN|nr:MULTISPECIES: MarR family transcriptional regulator [Streptomyces]MYV91347.1 MarR family transcriptional regulator [Streptomyces sp. SID1034]GGY59238.1 MarR family transcriptional regulator [Streptomyces xanthochromogenes]
MTAGRGRRDGEVELWRQLTVLTSRISNTLDKRLQRGHGVSVAEYTALVVMRDNAKSGGVRMQDLAEAVGLSQSTVSRLVARLENEGLAGRVISEEDRRVMYAQISEQGTAVIADAAATFQKELTTALDVASFDEQTASLVARLRHNPATAGG